MTVEVRLPCWTKSVEVEEMRAKGKEGRRRKEMDGRIVMGVVSKMYILHQLGHTYLYIFRGIVLHRRSLCTLHQFCPHLDLIHYDGSIGCVGGGGPGYLHV